MDDQEFAARRQAFGRAVEDYDRARPGYPAEAVHWCVGEPDRPIRVVDLGAGTGKLTEVVLDAGHEVVAVEPDDAMRDRLAERLAGRAGLHVVAGTAEDVPLPAAAADAVVAGQAWHWFDQAVAGPQLARIVRPGGTVAAVWNSRDEDVDWVRAWSVLVEEGAHPTGRGLLVDEAGPDFGAGFGPREDAVFHHEQVLAPGELVTLAASRSYTIALPEDRRRALLERVAELVANHPDLAGRDEVGLPYRVDAHRAVRR